MAEFNQEQFTVLKGITLLEKNKIQVPLKLDSKAMGKLEKKVSKLQGKLSKKGESPEYLEDFLGYLSSREMPRILEEVSKSLVKMEGKRYAVEAYKEQGLDPYKNFKNYQAGIKG